MSLTGSSPAAASMTGMTSLPKHARQPWTGPQALLGVACAALGVAIAVLGFTDIFVTVNKLVAPYWHWLAWTVILLGEGSFTGSYLGWVLLDLRDEPPRRTVVFLVAYLSAFAALSLALNLYAGRGAVPDLLSHLVVVGAFFGYLVFAKVLVRRLSADPAKRALEVALADARRYAVDVCRSQRGALWRWRVPSLLRRNILTGRLCDGVRQDVELKVGVGRTSGWEATVREWVLGEDGLNLPALADADAQRVTAGITAEVIPQSPLMAPGTPPAVPAQPGPQGSPPRVTPKGAPGAIARVRRKGGRKATDGDIADAIREMFAEGAAVTTYRVAKELPIGEARADRVLKQVKAERPPLVVAK